MSIDTQELNQLMAESATDAVSYLNENFEQEVSLIAEDLPKVDQLLIHLHTEHKSTPMSNEQLYACCSILGAYVGEIFKQTAGGEWFMDTSVPDAPFVVLNYAGKSFPFASICYEKLVNDPAISIQRYYELALEGSTQ